MNTFKSYLTNNKITQAEFAAQLGVQQGTISRLSSGTLKPSLALAIAIEAATSGTVPAVSWITNTSEAV